MIAGNHTLGKSLMDAAGDVLGEGVDYYTDDKEAAKAWKNIGKTLKEQWEKYIDDPNPNKGPPPPPPPPYKPDNTAFIILAVGIGAYLLMNK